MSILSELQKNKGTISSALGKSLAEKVLKGDKSILSEAVKLIKFDDKNVRAGAAKIIEQVAQNKPELVADCLKDLLLGLESSEPQTRWMIIHTFGFCAKLNPVMASKALDKAEEFLNTNSGACLWDRTILYLGYIGAVSEIHAKKVFPLLEKSLSTIPSQTKTTLESFERMFSRLDDKMKKQLLKYADKYSISSKSSVSAKAKKIIKKLKKI